MTYKIIFAKKLSCRIAGGLLAALLAASTLTYAQTAAVNPVVPNIVNYNGALTDASGKPLTATSGVTFSFYKESEGGPPLWMETQNIQPDSRGHFTAKLGSASGQGLPADLFASGEAGWLGVQVQGQAEQPRVLLLSVPYALKAADAETLGGMPASAFVLAAPATNGDAGSSSTTSSTSATANVHPPASADVTTTGGAVNALPLFTTATNIQNSIMTQTGTTVVNVAGKLNLPATGAATATAGKNSRPEAFVASSFNSSTSTPVSQTFQLQAEPAANDTANPSGTLNLMYGLGAAAPSETGLKISNKGLITFAAGQTFPGTTKGTVTSVRLTAPATDFTVSGSPVTSAGTLNFAWKVAPTSADTANAIVKRDPTGSFNVTNIIGTGTFSSNTANTFAITGSTSLDGGSAIVGSSTVTGGSNPSYGVYGNSASIVAGSTGVLGQDGSTAGAGFTMGVQGVSSNQRNGMGVFGFDGISLSAVFRSFQAGNDLFEGAGVWGDGGTSINATNIGVIGTVDDGVAGYFVNDSSSGKYTLEANAYNANSFPFLAFNAENDAGCSVDPNGNLNCTGSKNAVGDCNGCHTSGGPPNFNYAPGGNPYFNQPLVTDPTIYLSGGQNFGPVGTPTGPNGYPGPAMITRNLTPDKYGRPEGGHTLSEFKQIMRRGKDFDKIHPTCTPEQLADIEAGATPVCIPTSPGNTADGNLLQVMPWPTFSQMSDRDIGAIYAYLSAIPCIDNTTSTPPDGAPNELRNDCGNDGAANAGKDTRTQHAPRSRRLR